MYLSNVLRILGATEAQVAEYYFDGRGRCRKGQRSTAPHGGYRWGKKGGARLPPKGFIVADITIPGKDRRNTLHNLLVAQAMHKGKEHAKAAKANVYRTQHTMVFNSEHASRHGDLLDTDGRPLVCKKRKHWQIAELLPIDQRRPPRRFELTTHTKLRVCFPTGHIGSSSETARRFNIKAVSTVDYHRAGMSMAIVEQTAATLAELAHNRQYPFVVEYLAWDETGQKTSVKFAPPTGHTVPALEGPSQPQQLQLATLRRRKRHNRRNRHAAVPASVNTQRRNQKRPSRSNRLPQTNGRTKAGTRRSRRITGVTEQILMQRRFALLPTGSADSCIILPLPIEARVLQSNSAECIKAGIKSTSHLASTEVRKACELVFKCYESDAASANGTLVSHWARNLRHNEALHWFLCLCHQIQIITGCLLHSVEGQGAETLNSIYCSANVLRTGGLFLQCLFRLKDAVRFKLVLKKGPAPAGARDANRRWIESIMLDADDEDWVALLCLLNSCWGGPVAYHFYEGEKPDFDILVEQISQVLLRIIFPARPQVPLTQRWMKAYASLRWFDIAFGIHNLGVDTIIYCVNPSGRLEAVNALVTAADAPDMGTTMEASREEYGVIEGKRKARMLRFLTSAFGERNVRVMVQALAGLQYCMAWSLKSTKLRGEDPLSATRPVPYLDLVNPEFSPVTVAQQFYSTRLYETAEEAAAVVPQIFNRDGCVCEETISMMNRLDVTASASLYNRNGYLMELSPHKDFLAIDDRVPVATRNAVSASWSHRRWCCHDSSVGQQLARHRSSQLGCATDELPADSLTTPPLSSGLLASAKSLDTNTSVLENLHAGNKRNAQDNQGTEALASKHMLTSTRNLNEKYIKQYEKDDPDTAEEGSDVVSGRWNAIRILHSEIYSAMGGQPDRLEETNPATTEAWELTHARWADLTIPERAEYQAAAHASNACGQNVLVTQPDDDAILEMADDAKGDTEPQPAGTHTTLCTRPPETESQLAHHPLGDAHAPVPIDRVKSLRFKDYAIQWSERCGAVVEPCPKLKPTAFKHSCQDRGFCTHHWRSVGLPCWQHMLISAKLKKFVKDLGTHNPQRLPMPWALKLLMFERRKPPAEDMADGEVQSRRFALLGYHCGSPLWHTLCELNHVPPFSADGELVNTQLDPLCHEVIETKRHLRPPFVPRQGRLKWIRSEYWVSSLITEPGAIHDQWHVRLLNYSWTCLHNKSAPRIRMTVTSASGEYTWLNGPRLTVTAPAAPRPRGPRGPRPAVGGGSMVLAAPAAAAAAAAAFCGPSLPAPPAASPSDLELEEPPPLPPPAGPPPPLSLEAPPPLPPPAAPPPPMPTPTAGITVTAPAPPKDLLDDIFDDDGDDADDIMFFHRGIVVPHPLPADHHVPSPGHERAAHHVPSAAEVPPRLDSEGPPGQDAGVDVDTQPLLATDAELEQYVIDEYGLVDENAAGDGDELEAVLEHASASLKDELSALSELPEDAAVDAADGAEPVYPDLAGTHYYIDRRSHVPMLG